MKQTIKNTSLLCAFAVAIFLPVIAQAADAVDQAPTLRDSIDKAKASLADKLYGLQLSAFADMQTDYDDTGNHDLTWGSIELDASADLSENMQAAMALVKNKEEDAAATTGFLDYHTFGGSIAPRGRLWVEKGFHIQAGRFDVPFGNDWQFYASKDSVSISRPLTTDLVMDGGYNDTGGRVLGNNGSVNFNAFLLQGFNPGRLVGGRVGLTPFSDPFSLKGTREPKTLELGLSYLYDANLLWQKTETALAVDGELHLDASESRFEYVVRKKEPVPGDDGTTRSGWHVTQEYTVAEALSWPTTFFARYENVLVQPPEIATLGAAAGDERDVRVAAGFSANLFNGNIVQWKFEAQHYIESTPSTRSMPGFGPSVTWYTQLVLIL